MGRVTQISGVGWKAQLPFKDFGGRGSLCPCQPVSELPPTCLDKGIKWEGERGGQQKRKSNWCTKSWVGFQNYLIPVSAHRLNCWHSCFPPETVATLSFSSSHPGLTFAPPPPSLPPLSLSSIVYHSKRRDSQHTHSPFEYDGRGVFSEEQHHSVSCARPGLVIHLWPCNGDGYCMAGRLKWKRCTGQ